MKTVFELIEEHGLTLHGDIEHFAELVRADERNATLDEIAKWLESEKDAPYWAELVRARSNT